MALNRMSYLVKVPLALCIVSVLSALGIFIVTYYLLASYISAESFARVQQISSTLATTTRAAFARDDIWDLYQQVSAAVADDPATEILVLSEQGIVVSSNPIKYPVASAIQTLPQSIVTLSGQAKAEGKSHRLFALQKPAEEMVYGAAAAVTSEDGDRLATVVVYSQQEATLPKLHDLLWRVIGYAALALTAVISLGWWLGRRLVQPLNTLRLAMAGMTESHAGAEAQHTSGKIDADEISQLTKQFIAMDMELKRNRDLEAQMQAAERMAMAGKLASGLAHEVNNPLGGMLNALSNLRRYGVTDPYVEKTANLLERGLRQIQESISALMAQARREHTLLTCKDFDDLQMLSEPIAATHRIEVKWNIACRGKELGIRSVPVRQIVLNLVLNAIYAARTRVHVQAEIINEALHIIIYNDGPAFSAFAQPAPAPDRNGRLGLGLWVSFRLTQQLKGKLHIQPSSGEEGTTAIFIAPLENFYA